MKRPVESDYTSHVAYTRALEEYCDQMGQPKPMPAELRKALEDYFDKCFRREPLAEDVIGKLWDSTMKYTLSIDRLMAFTRAVEAAHGIREWT